MADSHSAKTALFTAIETVARSIDGTHDSKWEAAILKDLAAAYRMTYGGAQPGSSVLDSK